MHGGGYVAEATASHRRIIEELVKMYGLKVTFIDYPLAPEHTYEKTHEIVRKHTERLQLKITVMNFICSVTVQAVDWHWQFCRYCVMKK